mmetsp:Transcript_19475/g.17255  ORF Transcript_19475/g.17255 Transcript_19475/m.17255 type:complete len:134 (+) Transcript_19475:302-703(+)
MLQKVKFEEMRSIEFKNDNIYNKLDVTKFIYQLGFALKNVKDQLRFESCFLSENGFIKLIDLIRKYKIEVNFNNCEFDITKNLDLKRSDSSYFIKLNFRGCKFSNLQSEDYTNLMTVLDNSKDNESFLDIDFN